MTSSFNWIFFVNIVTVNATIVSSFCEDSLFICCSCYLLVLLHGISQTCCKYTKESTEMSSKFCASKTKIRLWISDSDIYLYTDWWFPLFLLSIICYKCFFNCSQQCYTPSCQVCTVYIVSIGIFIFFQRVSITDYSHVDICVCQWHWKDTTVGKN